MLNKRVVGLLIAGLLVTGSAIAEPLKIGYSDWPGWVAWQIAIEKKFFQKVGVDVDFEWFDYSASIDAFAAGQLDAVTMTNGDALVTGASGAQNVMIMINDYSDGNDMVVGAPGIDSLEDLKGKKVGVEIGFVDHLLLLGGLKKHGMTEADIDLVNVPTNETPQVLGSGQVSAIAAWQPNSGQALKAVPGAKPIYTSADEPGLIYDVLAVSPQSLAMHRDEWKKVLEAWYMAVAYLNDPATHDDAVSIMAARVGVSPKEYQSFMAGTRILTLPEAQKIMQKGEGFGSLYGSSKISDTFNVDNKVYSEPQTIDNYIDPSLLQEMK